MDETWTQRAEKVLGLMEKLPDSKPGSPEKQFQQAVWSLCQQVKELDKGDGQFVPPPLF